MNDRLSIEVIDEVGQALLGFVFQATRVWRRTKRVILERKPSIRLSQEPWVGVTVKVKRPIG
jgi:hypothetical protein